MSLTHGTRLGTYEVLGPLGAGGMGTVYRARDTKLGREVAIKVVSDAAAFDADRTSRFAREAQLLASLNHPHIATVHGLEQAGPTQFLVMELVDGETLAARLQAGALGVDEALRLARQIADALAAAHEKGIVHRDLKPANVALTRDGAVKVLDFGLAKLAGPAEAGHDDDRGAGLSMSPTLSIAATQAGVILGTAAYMSPEQAKGRPTDTRTDIWAFGCVLYEMLAGRPAFDGEDLTDIIGAVARLDPDWTALPADLPAPVRTLIRTCLQKDRRQRTADATTALFVLDHAGDLVDRRVERVETTAPRGSRVLRRLVTPAAAAVAALVGAGASWVVSRPEPPPVVRTTIATAGPTVLSVQGTDRDLVVAPDGSRVVYRGNNQLLVRPLDRLQPATLTGVAGAAGQIGQDPRHPFISPDGQWIGYFRGSTALEKVSVTGGSAIVIARLNGNPRGGIWTSAGDIVFATSAADTGLQAVPAAGGDVRVLTRPDRQRGEADHLWPELLPGGDAVLFTILAGGPADAQIAAYDLRSGATKVLHRGASHAQYVSPGYLVFAVGDTLRAVAFDADRLELSGVPVPVVQGVFTSPQGMAAYSVAGNGTLVYEPADVAAAAPRRSLVWVTRDGREEPAGLPPREYDSFVLSPDGARAAVQIGDQEFDIWVLDFVRRTTSRLTFSADQEVDPLWSPDGQRILFVRSGAGLYARAANGTGREERIGDGNTIPLAFSADGQQVVVSERGDLGLVRLDGKRELSPLLNSRFAETRASLSPDGRWLAYQSNESGQEQIYVQPFPDVSAGRWQVSPAGGTDVAWARNGREIFYIDGDGALVAVPVQTTPAFSVGNPAKLFDAPYVPLLGTRRYEVSPDGRRFLFIKQADDTAGTTASRGIVVVQNWVDELKRLVPRD